MNLPSILSDFFAAYGQELSIGDTRFHGILSPKSHSDPDFQKHSMDELGTARNALWSLLAPPKTEQICPGARVCSAGAEFLVQSSDICRLGKEPLYRYAVLQQVKKEDA